MDTDPLIPLPTLPPNHQVKDPHMEGLHLNLLRILHLRELTALILQRDQLAATLTPLRPLLLQVL
jgi:hypothetical protein